MKFLLSGGGTGGSVTPLIAIREELLAKDKTADFLWVGTKNGVEEKIVKNEKIKYKTISCGKLRRYFSFQNFIDPVRILIGFFQSLWIIFVFKPSIILTAGGFVAVPVVWAGWILRIPVLIHQQDVEVGLANKLMAPFATIITVSLKESCDEFKKYKLEKKVYFTGNAIRRKILNDVNKESILKKYNIKNDLPVVLVLGGGTGAAALNKIIVQILPKLLQFCQVLHITGPNQNFIPPDMSQDSGYHSYVFLDTIEEVLNIADLVVSRCGAGFYSELAVLGKPTIFIPLPDTHQVKNAKYFQFNNAAIMLNESEITEKKLTEILRDSLSNKELLLTLSVNIKKIMPRDGAKKIANLILEEIMPQ